MINDQNAEEGGQAQIAFESRWWRLILGVEEFTVDESSLQKAVRNYTRLENRGSWADWELIHAVEEGSGKDSVKWLNLWQISSDRSHNKQLRVFVLINSNEMGGLPVPRWVESLFLGKLRQTAKFSLHIYTQNPSKLGRCKF